MAKIIGHGAPTKNTPGALGSEYFDKDTKKVYTCTNVTHKTAYRAGEADAEYEWSVVGGSVSWNDLEDRPFGEKTILESNTIVDENLKCMSMLLYVTMPRAVEGDIYNITIDGVEYPNRPVTLSETTGKYQILFGDGSLVWQTNTTATIANGFTYGTMYHIIIEKQVKRVVITPIDIKYLPIEEKNEIIFRGSITKVTCDKTFEECMSIINDDTTIKAVITKNVYTSVQFSYANDTLSVYFHNAPSGNVLHITYSAISLTIDVITPSTPST